MSNDLRTPPDGGMPPGATPGPQRPQKDPLLRGRSAPGAAGKRRAKLLSNARGRQQRLRKTDDAQRATGVTATPALRPSNDVTPRQDGMEVSLEPAAKKQRLADITRQLNNPNQPTAESLKQVASDPDAPVVIPGPANPAVRPITAQQARALVARIEAFRPAQNAAASASDATTALKDVLTPAQLKHFRAVVSEAGDYALRETRKRFPDFLRTAPGAGGAAGPSNNREASGSSNGNGSAAGQRLNFSLRPSQRAKVATALAGAAPSVAPTVAALGVQSPPADNAASTDNDGDTLLRDSPSTNLSTAIPNAPLPTSAQNNLATRYADGVPTAFVSPADNESPLSIVAPTGSAASSTDNKLVRNFDNALDSDPLMHKTLADFIKQATTFMGWTLFTTRMMQRILQNQQTLFMAMQLSSRLSGEASVNLLETVVEQTATKVMYEQMHHFFTLTKSILSTQESWSTGPMSRLLCQSRLLTSQELDRVSAFGSMYAKNGMIASERAASFARTAGEALATAPIPRNAKGDPILEEESTHNRVYADAAEGAGHSAEELKTIRARNVGADGLRPEQMLSSTFVEGHAPPGEYGGKANLRPLRRTLPTRSELDGMAPETRRYWEEKVIPEFRQTHFNDLLTEAALWQREASVLRGAATECRNAARGANITPAQREWYLKRSDLFEGRAEEAEHEARIVRRESDAAAFNSLPNENRLGDYKRNFNMMVSSRDNFAARGIENLSDAERMALEVMNYRIAAMGDQMSKFAFVSTDNRNNRYNPGDSAMVGRTAAAYALAPTDNQWRAIRSQIRTRGFDSLSEAQNRQYAAYRQLEAMRSKPLERTMLSANAAARRATLAAAAQQGRLPPELAQEHALFEQGLHPDSALADQAKPAMLMQYMKDRAEVYYKSAKLPRTADGQGLDAAIKSRPDLFDSKMQNGQPNNPAATFMRTEYTHLAQSLAILERGALSNTPRDALGLMTALHNTDFMHSAPFRNANELNQGRNEEAQMYRDHPATMLGGAPASPTGIEMDTLDDSERLAHSHALAEAAIAAHSGSTYRNNWFEQLNRVDDAMLNFDMTRAAEQQYAGAQGMAGEAAGAVAENMSDAFGAMTEAQAQTQGLLSQLVQINQVSGW